jgi:hypothetical protein
MLDSVGRLQIFERRTMRVTVSLTPREHGELRALATSARVSLSWMIRQAVAEFLERQKGEVSQLPLNLGTSRRRRDSEEGEQR